MSKIYESLLWNRKDQSRDDFSFDQWESQSQGIRIFSRPLTAKTQEVRFSFKGRGIAILHLGKTIVREPFRLLKHLIVLIAEIAKSTLVTLNIPFSERARAHFAGRIKNTTSTIVGLGLRPIAYALELVRYIGAITIHPWFGIRLENKNP